MGSKLRASLLDLKLASELTLPHTRKNTGTRQANTKHFADIGVVCTETGSKKLVQSNRISWCLVDLEVSSISILTGANPGIKLECPLITRPIGLLVRG